MCTGDNETSLLFYVIVAGSLQYGLFFLYIERQGSYGVAVGFVTTISAKVGNQNVDPYRESSGIDLLTRTHKILPKPREERIQEVPICVKGTWDADIVAELKPDSHECIITKRRDSAFHCTGLEGLLRKLQVDTAIFCGIDTSMCVESSLRDAFNLGFDVMIMSDATASMNPKRYECTLDDVRSFYGLVIDAGEFFNDMSKTAMAMGEEKRI